MSELEAYVIGSSGVPNPGATIDWHIQNYKLPELNLCLCKEPEKKYSDSVCYLCWTCKKCGKFGGCDNKI